MRRPAATAAALAAIALAVRAAIVPAVPLSAEEIAGACANAEGLAHCGRLIEAIQLERLPDLATRDGDVLYVTLYPSGRTMFADAASARETRTYALWDYLDPVNIAVIYTTRGDEAAFVLLQRASGRTFEVPAEPRLSPDRQRLVTADFCAEGCRNEVAIWRVGRDGVRKEGAWSPPEAWRDATARWRSADTVVVEYTRAGDAAPRTLERRLGEPGWTRLGEP